MASRSRGPERANDPGAAREEALRILLRISEEGAWASRLLEALDERVFDARDIALTHEIVLGVLRWRGALDARIARLSHRRIERLDPAVREAFRIGAYQLLFLDRVPAHAAVGASVALARRASGPGAAGLVNAVLRKLAREAAESRRQPGPGPAEAGRLEPDPSRNPASPSPRGEAHATEAAIVPGFAEGLARGQPPWARSQGAHRSSMRTGGPLAARLAEELSHPEWFVARALERFEEEEARAFLLADNQPAPLTLRPNPLHPAAARLAAELESEGIVTVPGGFAPGALRTISGRPLRSRLFAEGAFWVQDEASQVIPLLFPPPWDGLSADLCAAPGGKSFVLATGSVVAPQSPAVMEADPSHRGPAGRAVAPGPHRLREDAEQDGADGVPGGSVGGDSTLAPPVRVIAFDLHEHRITRLARTVERLAPGRIAAIVADLAGAPPVAEGVFDRVLVDAPCSGTGVLRRHPEIRWRLTPESFAPLAELQSALLDTALAMLRPGGWLVYSVCSTEPEEGDSVLDAFLARTSCSLIDPAPHLPGTARSAVGGDRRLRTFPHRHGTDGFFAALVQKSRKIR